MKHKLCNIWVSDLHKVAARIAYWRYVGAIAREGTKGTEVRYLIRLLQPSDLLRLSDVDYSFQHGSDIHGTRLPDKSSK
jgi:hypothetical protein